MAEDALPEFEVELGLQVAGNVADCADAQRISVRATRQGRPQKQTN